MLKRYIIHSERVDACSWVTKICMCYNCAEKDGSNAHCLCSNQTARERERTASSGGDLQQSNSQVNINSSCVTSQHNNIYISVYSNYFTLCYIIEKISSINFYVIFSLVQKLRMKNFKNWKIIMFVKQQLNCKERLLQC